ncbi:MAG: TPM domain-containing protein [Clostridia bacterium]|nr:TPM domain-containing protein [Clostridia bacterium]
MKKFFIIIAACILLLFSSTVLAEKDSDVPRLPESDLGLTDSQKTNLTKKLEKLSEELKVDLRVYATTIADVNSYDFAGASDDERTYAEWIYEKENVGVGKAKSGAVLFIYYNSDNFELYTHGYAEEAITEETETYLEDTLKKLKKDTDSYYEVIDLYADMCDEIISASRNGETYEVPVPAHPKRLTDDANLLSDTEYEAVSKLLDEVSKQYDFDVVIHTLGSLGGKSSWNYARDFYLSNNYGMGEQGKDGILLLIAIGSGKEGERDWATYTSEGYGDAVFSDIVLYGIEDEVLDYLRPSDYYGAFLTFGNLCAETLSETEIEQNRDISYYDDIFAEQDVETYRYEEYMLYFEWLKIDGIWLFAAPALGAAIAFIILAIMKRKLKSVKMQPDARNYVKRFCVTESSDSFLYKNVSRVRINRDSGSGGSGGGGSGGHRGGGGHSGKF